MLNLILCSINYVINNSHLDEFLSIQFILVKLNLTVGSIRIDK